VKVIGDNEMNSYDFEKMGMRVEVRFPNALGFEKPITLVMLSDLINQFLSVLQRLFNIHSMLKLNASLNPVVQQDTMSKMTFQ